MGPGLEYCEMLKNLSILNTWYLVQKRISDILYFWYFLEILIVIETMYKNNNFEVLVQLLSPFIDWVVFWC